MLDLITASLDRRGISSVELATSLNSYAELIISENAKYNLTAITDPLGIAEKHFGDSLAGVQFVQDGDDVCDIGSGAGLPVVPLALAKKTAHFTAVEATGKKCRFLELASQTLGIGNLKVKNCRIEDYAREEGRERYDIVTARAVAPLATLLEYVVPLVKVGGKALIYKGANYQEELSLAAKAIEVFGIKIETIFDYVLENGEKRVIIVISKLIKTDLAYPRGANKPRLKPIQ